VRVVEGNIRLWDEGSYGGRETRKRTLLITKVPASIDTFVTRQKSRSLQVAGPNTRNGLVCASYQC
jgi:hypothetical protein